MKWTITLTASLCLSACIQTTIPSAPSSNPAVNSENTPCGTIERAAEDLLHRINTANGTETAPRTYGQIIPGEPSLMFMPTVVFQDEPDPTAAELAYLLKMKAEISAAAKSNRCRVAF